MNPKSDLDTVPGLPPELAELDAEMAQFTASERSSFAPELEAELEREWLRGPRRPTADVLVRRVASAAAVTLILTGIAVPPARASLVTGFQRLLDAFQEPVAAVVDAAPADPGTAMGLTVDQAEIAAPPVLVPRPVDLPQAGDDTEAVYELPAFRPAEVTYPVLVDEGAERDLIRRHYPPELLRDGVGGTVRLLLWVAEDGTVDNVQTQHNSGVPALDRAAMQGARSLRFRPATRDGLAVGTYVEFDLVFEPVEDEWVPPEIVPIGDPTLPPGLSYEIPAEGPLMVTVPAPIQMEARDLLTVALGESEAAIEARLGSLDGLLTGEPPTGVSPLRWRNDATRDLERAMAQHPDNPAPVLALARIRRKQGLRAEARHLFEQGLERTVRGAPSVSPRLVAELNYELGSIVRESWLTWAGLGRMPGSALDALACSRRLSDGGDLETLVAWNYVCPAELGAAMATSFAPAEGGEGDRREMLDRFADAVEAFPGHVGANVALLLHDADEELWVDLLNEGRRFAWATQGHPYSFLLTGLALQRLGRSEEALEDFERAFVVLGDEVEARFRDTRVLTADGSVPEGPFWAGLDPILNTEVNEREVEHLARAAYSYLRFGNMDSDAARLWLRYGRPQTVRTFGTADLRTEFWDYGQGPDLTLSRPAASDDRTFTPEGEAYLDDLLRVFPHWYGTRARSLFSLPAQAVRFRGDQPGTGEFEVSLEVPEALETFAGDSLDLGVFLVAADGSRVSATTRRIAGDSVRVRTGVGSDATWVVVELYNPRTHEAAAVRLPAFRGSDVGEDTRISDLVLVRAAAPMERDIGRTDAWVSPLLRGDVVLDAHVGLFFELYDVPGDTYRLRMEMESETTGEVVSVSFRPGAQTLFGAEWTRRPAGRAGRVAEYVTLDLAELGPDVYTLRARIDYSGTEEVVEELRGIRVRTGASAANAPAGGLENNEPS